MRTRAFTLVELLVAIGVSMLLVTLSLTITINLLNSWNQAQGVLATNASARSAFEQLELDLAALFQRADGQVWLAATVQRDQAGFGDAFAHETDPGKSDKAAWGAPGEGKPRTAAEPATHRIVAGPAGTDLEASRFGHAGVWLRFFSTRGSPDESGDGVHVVSYQIIRRTLKKASSTPGYHFCRGHSKAWADAGDPKDLGPGGYDLFAPGYNAYRGALKVPGHRATDRKRIVADGVIDFGVRILAPDSTGRHVEVFPVNRLAGATSAPTSLPYTLALTSTPGRLPPDTPAANPYRDQLGPPAQISYAPPGRLRFELMLRILTPEGLRLLQAFEENPGRFAGRDWWEIAEAHSRVYRRSVSTLSSGI